MNRVDRKKSWNLVSALDEDFRPDARKLAAKGAHLIITEYQKKRDRRFLLELARMYRFTSVEDTGKNRLYLSPEVADELIPSQPIRAAGKRD